MQEHIEQATNAPGEKRNVGRCPTCGGHLPVCRECGGQTIDRTKLGDAKRRYFCSECGAEEQVEL